MKRGEELLATLEAVHTAGLEAECWDGALEKVTRLTGASAASLETYDFAHRSHSMWRGFGNEPEMIDEYLSFHSSANPYAPRSPPSERKFPDGHVLDLAGLGREPFYAPYITYTDPGCFLIGILDQGRGPQTVFTLTRSPTRDHVEREQTKLFGQVLPHVRLALQVASRLQGAERKAMSLARALDKIRCGAALLDASGEVLHVNEPLAEILCAGDGLGLVRGRLQLASAAAREGLAAALAAVAGLRAGDSALAPRSFPAARRSDAPPYVLTLRPLFERETEEGDGPGEAASVLFVHDPLERRRAGGEDSALGVSLGLTPAEADLAAALIRGVSPSAYARRRGVSVNTAYTHLRRLKDKTGAHRLAELISRLNESAPA